MFGFLLIAYLIGSIPTAYLLSRWFGAGDIREVGSRNAGATNVTLNVGWLPGFLTLAGDMGKGYLAAAVGSLSSSPLVKYLTPAFAIAGHNWPVWLRFHGGGGLATFVGGCLAPQDGLCPPSDWTVGSSLHPSQRPRPQRSAGLCFAAGCRPIGAGARPDDYLHHHVKSCRHAAPPAIYQGKGQALDQGIGGGPRR